MSGNAIGGKAAAARTKLLYGPDFYARIGAIGGKHSRGGGFASLLLGADGYTGRERARIAGSKGGKISRRGKKV